MWHLPLLFSIFSMRKSSVLSKNDICSQSFCASLLISPRISPHMYRGPTFAYNPKTGEYCHPLFSSIPKTEVYDRALQIMGNEYNLEEILERIRKKLNPSYPSKVLWRPRKDIVNDVIREEIFSRRILHSFPQIELLTLVIEEHRDVSEIIFSPVGIRVLHNIRNDPPFGILVETSVVGHLLLSSPENVRARVHLLLMMGINPYKIYRDMRCLNSMGLDQGDKDPYRNVDEVFDIVVTTLLELKFMPCKLTQFGGLVFSWGTTFCEDTTFFRNTRTPDDREAANLPDRKSGGWCKVCNFFIYKSSLSNHRIHVLHLNLVKTQTLFDKLYLYLYHPLLVDSFSYFGDLSNYTS